MRDGSLYGRGSLDMKGGVVAGLAALRALVDTEAELDGRGGAGDRASEEDGGAGMLAAIRAGYMAEMAVITEPTRLEIVTAQAGAITFLLDDQRPLGPRRLPAARACPRIEKLHVIHDALLADERERNESEQNPAMRELGLPYPTNLGTHIRRRLVVDRARPADGRGTLRRARRRDAGAGRAGAARRRGRRLCRATSGCATTPPRSRSPAGGSPRPSVPHTHALPWGLGETARDVLGKLPAFRGRPLRRRHAAAGQRGRRRRPCSTAPASRSWRTPRTSTSSSRTWPAARGCWRCG